MQHKLHVEIREIINLLKRILTAIQQETNAMSAEMDRLEAQVSSNTTVVQSALTLIQGLRDQILAAGTDPAKLTALANSLQESDDALAAAVAANTSTPNA